jgi:hypothetical protein
MRSLWVYFLLLVAPIRDIMQPKWTANLQRVRAVIIKIWIKLPPALRRFMWRSLIEPCSSQQACCVIASPRSCFRHIVRPQIWFHQHWINHIDE